MLGSDVKGLYEAYGKIYTPKFESILDELSDEHIDQLTEDLIEEIVEEVFYECLEEGYDITNVENVLIESLEKSITALNEAVLLELNPYAPAGSKESGEYNKATTKSKRSVERSAKRAEVIGKVKEKVKKVGDTIKQKAAGAAVSAYAAGKMAKDAASPAVKAAGKAALQGAGKVAGKAVKYAKKAGEAVSAGYKAGSEGSSDSDSGSDSESSSSTGSSSGRSRGSIRSAAGNLLKRGIKKVLGVGARAVAGAAKGVHGLADKAAKRLGEEVVDEAKAVGKARSTDENPKGAEVRVSSGRGMTMTPAKGLGASKSTANNPAADDLRKDYYAKQAKADRRAAARDRAASGEDRVGRLIRSVQNSSYEPENLYNLVLEYLMTEGHADNLEEAHYVMSQLSDEYIQSIVEGVMPEPIDPVAHKTAQKTQKIYNLGKGTNNPNEAQSALKRTGPQLPGV
jgi:hypothetical protein